MRIIVTGANGYIGRHVVKTLLSLGISVAAVDKETTHIDSRAERYAIDIFNENVDIYSLTNKPDILIHMAWSDGYNHQAISHLQNMEKHFLFCERMSAAGIKKIICMGTVHEIGYHVGVVTEKTPCEPKCLYGVAKNALRQALFSKLLSKTCIIWIRVFSVYGDDLHSNSVFSKILSSDKCGDEFFKLNSGYNRGDYIQVERLAEQIAVTAIYEDSSGIYHCCTGQPITLREMVDSFIAENHLAIKAQYGFFPERSYDSPEIYGDNTKIKKIMKDNGLW